MSFLALNLRLDSKTCGRIPCPREQGIFWRNRECRQKNTEFLVRSGNSKLPVVTRLPTAPHDPLDTALCSLYVLTRHLAASSDAWWCGVPTGLQAMPAGEAPWRCRGPANCTQWLTVRTGSERPADAR